MGMDSRKRKKKKAIKMLNKKIQDEKSYRNLEQCKKLLRFLKESGRFRHFIKLVMKKHHVGFQGAIEETKKNPDIQYLIGKGLYQWTYGWFGSQTASIFHNDETTNFYLTLFAKFSPKL